MSYPQFGYPYPSVTTGLTSAQLLSSGGSGSTVGGSSVSPASSCCEGGRPIMTDPATGQTICSCQYSPALLGSYPRVAGLPDSMYGSAYAHGLMPLGTDPSAFYSPLSAGSSTAACYPYDPAMATYPYTNGYGGVDLQARRKNATRESTNTLKAWLYEHRKNPYPTKGEKIMLAIITKMTLTQVSTWFANARRRLKKENKMTWSPRNRTGDDDGDRHSDDGNQDGDKSEADDSKEQEDGFSIDVESAGELDDVLKDDSGSADRPLEIVGDARALSPAASPLGSLTVGTHNDPAKLLVTDNKEDPALSPVLVGTTPEIEDKNITKDIIPSTQEKPKIWSLAHTATSQTPPPARRSPPTPQGQQFSLRPPHTSYLPVSMGGPMNGLRYTPYSLPSSANPGLSPFTLGTRAPLGIGHSMPGTGGKLDTPPDTPPNTNASMSARMATPLAVHAKHMGLPALHATPGVTPATMTNPTDLSKQTSLKSIRDNQHSTAFKPVAIR